MGGFGSGRSGWRPKAEQSRWIDSNRLNRQGCLRDGYWGGWSWWRGGEKVAGIGMSYDRHTLTLRYRYCRWGDDWHDVAEPVPIERVACRFGGSRAFFRCPGVKKGRHCGRRVVKLYGPGKYFLCRHCYDIAYASQSESDVDRLCRRANTLRERLGGEPGICNPLPDKPKGMWWRTYERRLAEVMAADERAEAEWTADAARYLDRIKSR